MVSFYRNSHHPSMPVASAANGAADKPRRAVKPQAFPTGVGLIRVVARREASKAVVVH